MDTATTPELDAYIRGLSRTKPRQFIHHALSYLEYAQGQHDRDTVLGYLEKLRKTGYKESSLAFIFGIIRALHRRNGWAWEFRRGEGPQVQEDQVDAPAIDPDLVREMITAARSGILTPEESAYLALATVYGMRRTELGALDQIDINLTDRTLYVATAKHGRSRTHMIPQQIIPILEHHPFKPKSDSAMTTTWNLIEYRISFPHADRLGWHSVRRSLNTLLLDHLPPLTVASFLRWKQASSQVMPYRYHAVRYVGRNASTTKVFGEAKDVDQKVFEVHPFLPLWGDA